MIRFSPHPATSLLIAALMLVPLVLSLVPPARAQEASFRSDLPAPVLTQVSAGVSAGLA